MGLLDQIGGILKQYETTGTAPSAQDIASHFEQVANAVPSSTLADGIAHAINSNQTPAFGQIVGNLFNQANGDQRAGMLNQLIAAAGPQAQALLGTSSAATAGQAQQVQPQVVQQLAEMAKQADPSVVNKLSGFYAQHPALVKGLGAAALALVMSHVSQRQASSH